MDFKENRSLYKLAEIAAILRGENGCPWDKEQTHESLKKYVIEEAYEVKDAIESKQDEKIIEELGDLLFQVYFHADIAQSENRFTIDNIAECIISKLIRRHPHVFGNETAKDSNDVLGKWEKIKKTEKKNNESILDGVPKDLPALLKALRIQEKTSRLGFDWDKITDVEQKLDEEISEFKEAVSKKDIANASEEFGDILFTMVNISRFINIDPEEALQKSTNKFIERFKHVERLAREANRDISDMSLVEMDELWNEAKRIISRYA